MKNFVKVCSMFYLTKSFSATKRKGLATVITTVILLTSVSIMGVVLVAWSNTNLFTKQVAMEYSFNERMNKLNEDLLIENVWFGTAPSIVNVTLNNVGTISLNVTKMEIKNSTSTMYVTITNGGMAPDDDFSIQELFNWNSGETTDFTITTNRGNLFTFQEVT